MKKTLLLLLLAPALAASIAGCGTLAPTTPDSILLGEDEFTEY